MAVVNSDRRRRPPSPCVGTWLAEARDGSPESLGRLFGAVRTYLLLAANHDLPRSVRGKVGPSDVVQEALLAAHCRFESFQGGSTVEFYGWIRGILRHKLADSVRRYRGAASRDLERERSLADVGPLGERGWEDAAAAPESLAMRGEEAAALEAALQRLPLDQRTVIWMRHWEDRSFAEIAAACGKTEAAVRKIWARGFKRLEGILAPQADAGA